MTIPATQRPHSTGLPSGSGVDASAGAPPLIDLRGIGKEYRLGETTVHALVDVTLTFEPGCFTAVAGPSGGGKSTLLNIMGALDVATSGEYRLDGALVSGADRDGLTELRRERFGFVFQSFNLMPVLSAVENVELALAHRRLGAREARERALDMLGRVGVADRARHRPAQLSGGQQQRVAIARALVAQPRVIFCDEPTANLDEASTHAVVELMRGLNERHGVSFVIATHDPAVHDRARRVHRFAGGRRVS